MTTKGEKISAEDGIECPDCGSVAPLTATRCAHCGLDFYPTKERTKNLPIKSEAKAGTWGVFLLLAAMYLVGNFLYRALTVAGPGDGPEVIYLTIFFDLLVILSLIGLKFKISLGTSQGSNVLWEVVFWVALAAGAGLLLIRFNNGVVGWYTGHLVQIY